MTSRSREIHFIPLSTERLASLIDWLVVVLEHETNLETLRDAAKLLERENRKLLEKVLSLQSRVAELEGKAPADLQQRLALLETQLAQRNKMIFGASSEKRSRGEETHANAERGKKGTVRAAGSLRSLSSRRRTTSTSPTRSVAPAAARCRSGLDRRRRARRST
ncbi:MAG: hypothetical protein R3A48_19140 [Polyangiales bacterium]